MKPPAIIARARLIFPTRRREQLLDVNIQDVKNVAQKYLVDQVSRNEIATAVLGEKREWVDSKDGWATLELSFDEKAIAIPEEEAKVVL